MLTCSARARPRGRARPVAAPGIGGCQVRFLQGWAYLGLVRIKILGQARAVQKPSRSCGGNGPDGTNADRGLRGAISAGRDRPGALDGRRSESSRAYRLEDFISNAGGHRSPSLVRRFRILNANGSVFLRVRSRWQSRHQGPQKKPFPWLLIGGSTRSDKNTASNKFAMTIRPTEKCGRGFAG